MAAFLCTVYITILNLTFYKNKNCLRCPCSILCRLVWLKSHEKQKKNENKNININGSKCKWMKTSKRIENWIAKTSLRVIDYNHRCDNTAVQSLMAPNKNIFPIESSSIRTFRNFQRLTECWMHSIIQFCRILKYFEVRIVKSAQVHSTHWMLKNWRKRINASNKWIDKWDKMEFWQENE